MMDRPPPEERPSARELASQVDGESMQIAGKPAAVCPYCGCGMFVFGKPYNSAKPTVWRYVECRNCGRAFTARYWEHGEIVSEVKRRKHTDSQDLENPP